MSMLKRSIRFLAIAGAFLFLTVGGLLLFNGMVENRVFDAVIGMVLIAEVPALWSVAFPDAREG